MSYGLNRIFRKGWSVTLSLSSEDLSSAHQLSKLLAGVRSMARAKCVPDSTPGNGRCSPAPSVLVFGLMPMSSTDPKQGWWSRAVTSVSRVKGLLWSCCHANQSPGHSSACGSGHTPLSPVRHHAWLGAPGLVSGPWMPCSHIPFLLRQTHLPALLPWAFSCLGRTGSSGAQAGAVALCHLHLCPLWPQHLTAPRPHWQSNLLFICSCFSVLAEMQKTPWTYSSPPQVMKEIRHWKICSCQVGCPQSNIQDWAVKAKCSSIAFFLPSHKCSHSTGLLLVPWNMMFAPVHNKQLQPYKTREIPVSPYSKHLRPAMH